MPKYHSAVFVPDLTSVLLGASFDRDLLVSCPNCERYFGGNCCQNTELSNVLFRETIFNICSVKCAKSLISGGFQALLQVLFIFDVTTEGTVGQLRGSGGLTIKYLSVIGKPSKRKR